MRTPDSDGTATGDAASLAEGFGTIDTGSGDDTSDTGSGTGFGFGFGEGDPGGQQASALEGTDTTEAEAGTYDVDPADVASGDDYDYTGDGAVDEADLDEALHSLFNFGVDGASGAEHDGGGDDLAGGDHHDDGGATDAHHDDLGGFF